MKIEFNNFKIIKRISNILVHFIRLLMFPLRYIFWSEFTRQSL